MTSTVLITGAAAGIGRATARQFLDAGWRVGAFDIDVAGVDSLHQEVANTTDARERLVTGLLDVRDADAWRAALDQTTNHTDGALDVLVNNAGVLISGPFAQADLADAHRVLDINVGGVLTGCHVAHPYLKRAENGHVVNLASAAAVYGQAELAVYSASKFAVRGLTEALDLEWRRDGIACSAVWPLFTKTDMTAHMDIGSTRTLGVHLTPDEVARVVYHTATRRLTRWRTPHIGAGLQARTFVMTSQAAPTRLLRLVNRVITRS